MNDLNIINVSTKQSRKNLFQVVERTGVSYNYALGKVIYDIYYLAKELKFNPVYITWITSTKNKFESLKKRLKYQYDWYKSYNKIKNNSIVLLQHPLHAANNKILKKLKYKKNVKFISVIIDIEELRCYYYNNDFVYYKQEFETMLEISDILIVHNNTMFKYFVDKGISEKKLINIESFDYLQKNDNVVEFERSISFAGNLDVIKCGFIAQLNRLKNIKINLYGVNFNNRVLNSENIKYHGSFQPDEISKKLDRGFGLVWDGDSIDSCSGYFGQYLKYNNPHKLSLYLSCGIPVVIWKYAAQAEFVKKYNVGICVENLQEAENIISNMNADDYNILTENVKKIKPLLCSGHFTIQAIKKALDLINKN